MSAPKHFYITTTLPYVNAEPHIGHAAEFVHADILARFHALLGDEVFFNIGTDEHGLKVQRKALEAGKEPKAYVDELVEKFKVLKDKLGLLPEVNFIRTTDPHHIQSAQAFWMKCKEAGYIYKKNYKVKYCVGCELEKTDSELVNGKCPIHPNLEIENIEEENYFFKFSEFQKPLLELYAQHPDFVVPDFRFNEIKAFVERGLEDFSISRLKEKMSWGVPVPDDADHVMYVWFDALVNYVSAIGWPDDMERFNAWWPVTQLAGKDNLRQQSAMWQAMLLAAGLPPSKQIIIRGFIMTNGEKMSKSLGNVISPDDILKDFSTDVLRYYFARVLPFEDSDVTLQNIKEMYNGNLANGLGNLISRVMKMAQTNLESAPVISGATIPKEFVDALTAFNPKQAVDVIWEHVGVLDRTIQEKQPFTLVKNNPEEGKQVISSLVANLHAIALMLAPIMPETSRKIIELIKANKAPETPLFPRKD